MKEDLENKTAVVTGASSGIGKATAEKLAEEGSQVVLASRSKEKLEKIAQQLEEEYGTEALPIETDVSKKEEVEELIDRTVDRFGGLDILVNNAGIGVGSDVEDLSDKEYRKMMDVNCDGMFFTARAAIPHLEEINGNMIFLGSIAGQYPRPSNPVYASTKWWTRGFALSLSSQIGDKGVGVTVVNPSEVRTQFASESGKSFEQRFEKGKVTEPEDVADAIIFAAKQEERNTINEIDVYRRDKLEDIL